MGQPEEPLILAIECATGPGSVALSRAGKLLGMKENPERNRQSAALMPMVEALLKECGVSPKELHLIACTVGPGSFTGLRVGLAAARGLGFALGVPVLGYTTLKVLAHGAGDVLVLLNAGKGEIIGQFFGARASTPQLWSYEEARTHAARALNIVGDALPLIGLPASQHPHPRAETLAQLAFTQPNLAREALPYYVRGADAKPMTNA